MAEKTANAQVKDAVGLLTKELTAGKLAGSHGAGVAFQSVAMSTSLAIQDGTDYLRSVGVMATATIGVALAQLVATQDKKWADVIEIAQKAISGAAKNLGEIGKEAVTIASTYPVKRP